MSNDTTPARLIRLAGVMDKTGLGRTAIYVRMRAGTFPRAVTLGDGGSGTAVAWLESEVESWIAAQIARRDRDAAECSR